MARADPGQVCLTDEPAAEWAGLNGKAPADGMPLLRHALDALAAHYRADRPEAA